MRESRTPAASPVERLLQRLRPHRARRLSRREVRMEVASGLLLAGVVALMAAALPGDRHPAALDVALLIALHAACSRVRLYLGGGYGMPTQLVLVPMLFLLPPAAVPLAVAAGLCLATLFDVVRGGAHPDRALSSIGDAWHAVGPALVFAAAGAPSPSPEHWLLLVPALAAQALLDTVSALLREWIGRGIPPTLQLRVMAWVYGVDVLLTPIGFLAVIAPLEGNRGWVLLAPLTVVMAGLLADRRRRIEQEIARADDVSRERARLQAVMRRVGRALAANLDRDAMLAAVLETAREALSASVGWARAPEPASGWASDADAVLQRAASAAATSDGTAAASDGEWYALACGLGSEEVLAVARRGTPFTPEEAEILDHLAVHAAMSLENARLHERVREQATVDELTGLANHRSLQALLTSELDAAAEISLVMLDIDDFKHVNDTWGHLEGDRVLREVAKTIQARCRSVDRPARYGGEELAVALPRTDAAGALRIAEDLRRAIEDTVVASPDGPAIRVTVSAGVASASDFGATPSELVAAADRALYEAKRAGKNRTVLARAVRT